jgi:hypothetical protein
LIGSKDDLLSSLFESNPLKESAYSLSANFSIMRSHLVLLAIFTSYAHGDGGSCNVGNGIRGHCVAGGDLCSTYFVFDIANCASTVPVFRMMWTDSETGRLLRP